MAVAATLPGLSHPTRRVIRCRSLAFRPEEHALPGVPGSATIVRRDRRGVVAATSSSLISSRAVVGIIPQGSGPGPVFAAFTSPHGRFGSKAPGFADPLVDRGHNSSAVGARHGRQRQQLAVNCSDAGNKEDFADHLFRTLGFGARSRDSVTRTRASKEPLTLLELEKAPPLVQEPAPAPRPSYNGVFLLCLINLAVFAADHLLKFPGVRFLYLFHGAPRWYQFLTATFCHASWAHLSSNIFFVYIFGKLLEEEEGLVGLWATYFVTGVGANLLSYLLLPHSAVSIGASGAVFGLFVVSVLVKLSWNWRKILEVVILGQFVIEKVLAEARASTFANGVINENINHVAHLGGALLGVCLICLLNQVASKLEDKRGGAAH